MAEERLISAFHDVSFTFLKNKDLYLSEDNPVSINLKSYEYSTFAYVVFQIVRENKIIESIKLSETYLKFRDEYVIDINLFLVRFYSSIDKYLKEKSFAHTCPECNSIHINRSIYFNRNYICDKCLHKPDKIRENKNNEYVYFFESELTKLIKIGYSSNVKKRRKQIEAMQGGKINTLKVILSSKKNEKYLHERFSHLKTHGEWFLPNQELLTFIKELKEEDII